MSKFPKTEIPDFLFLSRKKGWDPKKYSPLIFNPKLKKLSETLKPGTLEYDDFWDEMDYYCYNGYKPKGMPRITGRHFYYLNMCKIKLLPKGSKNKILSNPFYRDLDHMLFLEIEAALEYGYGLIIAKPRQIGLSEVGAVNCNYQGTFGYLSEIGICAGKDDKVQEFKEKLESSLKNTHKAYRNGKMINNDNVLKLGYHETINKQKEEFGIQSIYRFKTMYSDSGAFEGANNNKLVIFEEAGLFENIAMSFKATEPTFKSGAIQYGIPLVYGTGGEIDKGAKGYKEMWDNSDSYNLKKIFIPAYFFYPGDGGKDKKTGKTISFFNHETGVTNRQAAKEHILKERKIAEKSKDTYVKHLQTYPLTPSEVFLKTKGGILDPIKLNFQIKKINAGEEPEPVLKGRLDWVDDERTTVLLQRAKNTKEKTKIRLANGSKVKFIIDEENGTIWKDSNPINQNIGHLGYEPDIGACDSYDEQANEDGNDELSFGCVMAYRCFSGPTREFNKPIGLLVERGDGSFDDDVFYENAVKFALYWKIKILFEYTKFHIIRYFIDVGAEEFIKMRPNLEEAGTNNHKNTYGIKMTSLVKSVLIKLLKLEVKDNIHKCFFMNVILDLLNFGEKNTDIGMTYGICLLHRLDIFPEITEDIEIDNGNFSSNFFEENYYVDSSGSLRINSFGEQQNIQTFHPERDLDNIEYQNYINDKKKKENKVKEEQKKFENDYKSGKIDESILQMIIEEQKNNNR